MSGINLPNIKLRTMSLEELETELQENKERDIKYRQLWEKFKNDCKSIQEFNLSRERSQFYFSHGFSCHTIKEIEDEIKRREQPNTSREYLIAKCKQKCQELKLIKRQTVSRETKYTVAQSIGIKNLGSLKNFKSGKSKSYAFISKMLSELGYCKKVATKYPIK